MKVWKKFLILIGIILIIFVISIARKVWIIKDLQKKVSNYANATNYYVKITTTDEQKTISETYKKDDKYLAKLEVLDPNGPLRSMISYCNGETVNTYIETNAIKVAYLNSNGLPSPATIVDFFGDISTWEFIKTAMSIRIMSEEYNGKDCYKIYYKNSPNMLYSVDNEDWDIYFEKATGLMIKSNVTEYEYGFNTVTDADLVEPDIAEYEVQE